MRTLAISACLLWLTAAASAGWKKDIEFAQAGGVSLTLDAYEQEGKGPFPTVIIVHGGGFVNGNKTTYVPPLFQPLIDGGFAIFTIDYRLAPQHPFPAGPEDVAAAIRWVKKNGRQYKADPRRIALVGESAGGYLVAWAGTRFTPETRVQAVVDFYGPHDMVSHGEWYWDRHHDYSPNLKAFFGVSDLSPESRRKLWDASPYRYVRKDMPPFLFIHGTKDAAVNYEQSVSMCGRMKSVGANCEVFTVADGPHGVGPWEKEPRFQGYKTHMVEWLRRTLR